MLLRFPLLQDLQPLNLGGYDFPVSSTYCFVFINIHSSKASRHNRDDAGVAGFNVKLGKTIYTKLEGIITTENNHQ